MSESNLNNNENLNEENIVENIQDNENEEIEFDDNIDIEALQAQLQQHMSAEGVDYTPDTSTEQPAVFDRFNEIAPVNSEENDIDQENNQQKFENFVQSLTDNTNNEISISEDRENSELTLDIQNNEEKPRLQLGEKKYIIYIEPDNIDFIEAMTIKERKKIINRLLKEEDTTLKKQKRIRERAKFINQVLIMVATVVVSLPIFFVLLNKSIEVTILNYQQSQQNFVKLYKEQGKIKSYKNFQKTFD